MSLRKQQTEIQRLADAFAAEAQKFHDLTFSIHLITQETPPDQKFREINHAIILWQYYGAIAAREDVDHLMANIQDSDMKWGVRGAQLSLLAVIEGEMTPLFVRMAKRAGNLFSEKDSWHLKKRVLDEIMAKEKERNPQSKPTGAVNDNPLAAWLNFLLYHLSITNPGRENSRQIEPDPFSLSLLALERLATDPVIAKIDRSSTDIGKIHFKVALSFPGERRGYVSKVADRLRKTLGTDAVFYDFDYQAQLARPNLDTLLQDIYRNRSDLIVVFICEEYGEKQWCGLEWRAVRDILKMRDDQRVMLVRFDDAKVDGIFSIDGYIDARIVKERDLGNFILQRVASISSSTAT